MMLRQQAEGHVTQIQLQAEGQVANIQHQAEGHLALATSQAEDQISVLTAENQQLSQDRDRLQLAAHVAEEEVQRLRSEVDALRNRTTSPSETAPNPFASPAQGLPRCPTDIVSAVGSCASASAAPMETMYCPCCGSQNVVGRPSCWKCQTMFNATIANNGADVMSVKIFSSCAGRVQAASAVPSSFIALQVPVPSAFIAAPAQGCVSIAAKPASLVSGGDAPVASAGLTTGFVPPATPIFFDPNGPRIQGGHVVGNTSAGAVGSQIGPRKSSQPPSVPGNIATAGAKFFRMNSSTNSQDSTDHGEVEQRGAGDGGIPPGDWLLQGETDEDIYKIKHLKGIQITRLPNDATSCREWRAAF